MSKPQLFASSYDYAFDDGILWLEDLNGPKSLTNDMENAIAKITLQNAIPLDAVASMKIMYKDSEGTWDGVRVLVSKTKLLGVESSEISSIEFFSINETDYELAKYKLLAMK